jgi:hypothetical protein
MGAPECVFCHNYKRAGRDTLVRSEDVHVCLLHNVIIPWQQATMYVCSDFDFNGAETGVLASIKANCPEKDVLYSLRSSYSQLSPVAKFSELKRFEQKKGN